MGNVKREGSTASIKYCTVPEAVGGQFCWKSVGWHAERAAENHELLQLPHPSRAKTPTSLTVSSRPDQSIAGLNRCMNKFDFLSLFDPYSIE